MQSASETAALFRGTVVELLADAASARPNGKALVCGDEHLDYAGYAAAAFALGAELQALSRPGSRIATLLGNSIDACVAHFGALAAGRQLLPMNPGYTVRELDYQLRDSLPDVVLADLALRSTLAPVIASLGIATIWVGAGVRRLADHGLADAPIQRPVAPASLAILQYTGGTSGKPKGVNLTHAALRANVAQREAVLPTRADEERILCAMPLFHSYGMAMGLYLAARCRGTLVILPSYRREQVLDAVERHAITVFPGSPTIYIGILDHPRFAATNWSSVRTCYSGAAALPVAVMRRWQEAVGVPIHEGYGQTEAGPVLSYNSPLAPIKTGSVGRALPGTRIEIVDLDSGTQVLPAHTAGEIRARGPQLMQGYRNLPADTAQALRQGWLYTGDIGELDDDGYLFIRDRKKDMVIVGGYNVYPREVEEVLQSHPQVLEAAVIGAPDDYRGEVLHAFVVLRADGRCSEDELQAYCAENLARYKCPARVSLVDRLPKTPVNKIDKKALQALT